MILRTTQFGVIDVDPDRIIRFKDGLLGFPERKQFALFHTSIDPVFYWLQSVDDPALAFVVYPAAYVPDYEVPLRADDLQVLNITEPADALLMVIVNKVGPDLTANLLGPLLIGSRSQQGRQLVLSDKRFSTRRRLMPAPEATEACVAQTA